MRKATVEITNSIDYRLLSGEDAMNLIRLLHQFPDVVLEASKKYEPSMITRHIVDIAQAFNKFYHDTPIIVEDESLQKSRLALVYAVKQTIANGLGLLGIAAPEKM